MVGRHPLKVLMVVRIHLWEPDLKGDNMSKIYVYCYVCDSVFEKDGREKHNGGEVGSICGDCREKQEEKKKKKK